MDPNVLQIVWMVPYKPGTLTAIAYKNGKKVAAESVSTASKPADIKLSADRMTMEANRRDVIYITADIVDSKGMFVPYATNEITFDVKGSYKLIGVENGDILDINPQKILKRKAFMGKVLLMLQATDQKGTLIVQANSPDLKSSMLTISCK
jgi:beta-galactosidase